MLYKVYECLEVVILKVRQTAKIRKRYNQVPHLTQDILHRIETRIINITNKSKDVSPLSAGDHNAAINRRKSMRNTRHTNTNDPQKKSKLDSFVESTYIRTYSHNTYTLR